MLHGASGEENCSYWVYRPLHTKLDERAERSVGSVVSVLGNVIN